MTGRDTELGTRLQGRAGKPGWIEPPGSTGYRLAMRRQLKRFVLWLIAAVVIVALLGLPYLRFALADYRTNLMAQSELLR